MNLTLDLRLGTYFINTLHNKHQIGSKPTKLLLNLSRIKVLWSLENKISLNEVEQVIMLFDTGSPKGRTKV